MYGLTPGPHTASVVRVRVTNFKCIFHAEETLCVGMCVGGDSFMCAVPVAMCAVFGIANRSSMLGRSGNEMKGGRGFQMENPTGSRSVARASALRLDQSYT